MEKSKEITFENMPKVVSKIYEELVSLKNKLSDISVLFEPKKPTEYLTRKEVAELCRCDKSTVHNWTKKGKLKKHCIGDKVLYIRREVEEAIKHIKPPLS